jgi:hypothetical protein
MKMLMDPTLLQWVGCVLVLAGSLLLAVKGRLSGYAFVLFLVSNAIWAAFGVGTSAPGLVVMQGGCSITSVIGVWQWLLRPRIEARALSVRRSMLRVPRARKLNLVNRA